MDDDDDIKAFIKFRGHLEGLNWDKPPPQGKRLVRDRLLKEAEEELERKLKEE